LLDSQFKTLEPPQADERPFNVSIDAPVETVVDNIVAQVTPQSTEQVRTVSP